MNVSNIPTRVGEYKIHGRLAAGGMAEVFIGTLERPNGFQRHFVIKRILPHLADDPDFVTMFLSESRIAAKLVHPNIVQVFDAGQSESGYYYAMEYVHGDDLRSIMRAADAAGESIPLPIAIAIVRGVAAALHHSHTFVDIDGTPLQIVHRDVSPTNILVGYDGSIKLVDFGIAKILANTATTRAGARKGKLAYMSPEQCRGDSVDPRSDVFSLGIVLYELTTMQRLFKSGDDFGTMYRIVAEDVRPPSTRVPGYPPDLERIVLGTLRRDRSQRYASARDMLADLEAWARKHGALASPSDISSYLRELIGDIPMPWTDLDARTEVVTRGSASALERRRRGRVALAAASLVGAVGLAGVGIGMARSSDDERQPAPRKPSHVAEDRARPPESQTLQPTQTQPGNTEKATEAAAEEATSATAAEHESDEHEHESEPAQARERTHEPETERARRNPRRNETRRSKRRRDQDRSARSKSRRKRLDAFMPGS